MKDASAMVTVEENCVSFGGIVFLDVGLGFTTLGVSPRLGLESAEGRRFVSSSLLEGV